MFTVEQRPARPGAFMYSGNWAPVRSFPTLDRAVNFAADLRRAGARNADGLLEFAVSS